MCVGYSCALSHVDSCCLTPCDTSLKAEALFNVGPCSHSQWLQSYTWSNAKLHTGGGQYGRSTGSVARANRKGMACCL